MVWKYYPGQKKRTIWEIDQLQAKTLFWSFDIAWSGLIRAQAMSRSDARPTLTARSGARRGGAWLERRCNNHVQRLQAKVWKWRLRHDRSWKHENKQACWQWHFGCFRLCGGFEKKPMKKRPEVVRGERRTSWMSKSKPTSSECGHRMQRGTQSCDQPSTRQTVRPLLDLTGPTLLREPGEDRRSWRCRLAERCFPSSSPKRSR